VPEDPESYILEEGAAAALVGKRILIGLTSIDSEERPFHQEQFYGEIVDASPTGVSVRIDGKTRHGETVGLPPDKRAYQPAKPGTYRLRSTGEAVENPDIVSTWTIEHHGGPDSGAMAIDPRG
jgi:hypothetical protein